MKHIHTSKRLTVLCLILCLSYSCTKETAATSTATEADRQSSEGINAATNALTTLTLQPGPADGQDAFVEVYAGDATYITKNFNSVPELPVSAWTAGGQEFKQRVYLKFTGLSAIPPAAVITSARLSLYGLNPNTSVTHHEGNSTHPGSVYDGENTCIITAITGGDWQANAITWSNKPQGYKGIDIIPASASQWNYNVSVNVTDLVKNMVGAGGNNYGFGIALKNEKIYRTMLFASSEATDSNKRPRLVVTYQ